MKGSGKQRDEGGRRRCQACFKVEAEHHCQVCRRFVCDVCVAPPGSAELDGPPAGDPLWGFLQQAQTRCNACRDQEVELPELEIHAGDH